MTTPNDSLTTAFEDLLNSINNPSQSELNRFLDSTKSSTSEETPLNTTIKMDTTVSGFCSENYEWVFSQQEHDCCKCIKDNLIHHSPDVKNIITTGHNFHFCGLDLNEKCASSTKIETFISDQTKRRRSNAETNTKTKKRLKINWDIWKPAKLEICLQDIYCSDVILKYIEPKRRFERGTIVWAKMSGYPNWPAMIDDDPDYKTYYWIMKKDPEMVQYHVVFFDEDRFTSRCWSPEDRIKPFAYKPYVNFKSLTIFQRFQAGFKHAQRALKMNIEDRIETYGFAAKMNNPNVTLVEG